MSKKAVKKNTKKGAKKGSIRLNFDVEIPIEHHERFRMIMYACGLKSFPELMNHSFSVLEWSALEIIKGQKVGSFSDDGKTVNLLDAPSLRKVAEMRDEMLSENAVMELALQSGDTK